jgi:hypothetical protein
MKLDQKVARQPEINPLNITNYEKQKENRAADQFFSSLLRHCIEAGAFPEPAPRLCPALSGGMVEQDSASRGVPPGRAALSTAVENRSLRSFFVILIETTELLGFLGAVQLSTDKAELRTVVRPSPQATIGPQLPLASEPVRGLDQRDQVGCSNGTDARNLAQQFRCFMFPALGQKLGSQVSPQGLKSIQLSTAETGWVWEQIQ